MWQISALGPMIGQCMYMKRIATTGNDLARLQFSIDRFHAESLRLLRILNSRLEGRDYLCGAGRGAFTLADISCYGYAASWWWAGLSIDDMPAVQRWLQMLEDRHPSVRRGLLVPGVSVLGPSGVVFDRIYRDKSVQDALLASAAAAGRVHFNWKDMQALARVEGEVFKADARPPTVAPSANLPGWAGREVTIATSALLVGFILGKLVG